MNIQRGLAQFGVAKADGMRAPQTSAGQTEKPAFELPDHDAVPAKQAFAGDRMSSRDDAHTKPTREPVRQRDVESREESKAPMQETPAPKDGPNAAARRDAGGESEPAETQDNDSASTASSESAPASTADNGHRRAPAEGDDTALPDRMLALLSAGPFAAAPVAAGPAVATAPTGAALPGVAHNTSTLAPALPGAPASGIAAGLRPGLQAGANAIATDASAMPALAATAASPATSAEAFAALASLADRPRDTLARADDGSPSPNGFGPLLARGLEALQTPVRAAAVAAPAPLPLMLDADFDDGLGARVTWMAEQRIDHAQIRVSPESLGPIDVRLQMDGHRVNAQFHAANADVRQALESGMDRLRDMLGRQGMELGQAQVGSGARQGSDARSGSPGFTGDATGDATPAEPQGMRVAIPRSRGLLDEYA